MQNTDKTLASGASRDPLTGTPATQPAESGIDAALGGAAVGAAAGTIAAGPVGTVIGAAVGAIVGGLADKDTVQLIDPSREADFWRANFTARSYVAASASYGDYGPAYGFGVDAYTRYPDRSFDDIAAELARDWDSARGNSALGWERAMPAARDAWHRVDEFTRDAN